MINHSILLVDDKIDVSPPITGSILYDQINELINIANTVSRVSCPKTTKLDKNPQQDSGVFTSDKFSSLQQSLPEGLVESIRESVRSRVASANAFVDQWISHHDYWYSFFVLGSLPFDSLAHYRLIFRRTGPSRFADLPADLLVWKHEVQTLYKTKAALSDSNFTKSFGAIQVTYAYYCLLFQLPSSHLIV